MVGGGTRLFPATGVRRSPRLVSAHTLRQGAVRLVYAFD
jgi:hypothetical protein